STTFQCIERAQLVRLLGGVDDAKVDDYCRMFGWETRDGGIVVSKMNSRSGEDSEERREEGVDEDDEEEVDERVALFPNDHEAMRIGEERCDMQEQEEAGARDALVPNDRLTGRIGEAQIDMGDGIVAAPRFNFIRMMHLLFALSLLIVGELAKSFSSALLAMASGPMMWTSFVVLAIQLGLPMHIDTINGNLQRFMRFIFNNPKRISSVCWCMAILIQILDSWGMFGDPASADITCLCDVISNDPLTVPSFQTDMRCVCTQNSKASYIILFLSQFIKPSDCKRFLLHSSRLSLSSWERAMVSRSSPI
ncbi:hypothetical protein PENTCL1PPCAC_4035, partial [Pristionchus entomophagus]